MVKFGIKFLKEYHVSVIAVNNPAQAAIQQHWIPPPVNQVKINFDAAIFKKSRHGGIGVVARNSAGSFLAACSLVVADIVDPEHVELLALKEAIKLCKELRVEMVVLEGDALNIIGRVCSEDQDFSPLGTLIDEVRFELRSMKIKDIRWVPRNNNSVAHELAQYAKDHSQDVFWKDHPPDFLQPLLQADIFCTS